MTKSGARYANTIHASAIWRTSKASSVLSLIKCARQERKAVKFKLGDRVRPRPEWKDDPNNVPSGRIVWIEPLGEDGAIHVEGERRAFAA